MLVLCAVLRLKLLAYLCWLMLSSVFYCYIPCSFCEDLKLMRETWDLSLRFMIPHAPLEGIHVLGHDYAYGEHLEVS